MDASSTSSVRAPRCCRVEPVDSNSGGYQPVPMPYTNRPPLRCCRVAISLANITGCRVGRTRTDVPSLTRLVTAATCARVIIGSVQLTR